MLLYYNKMPLRNIFSIFVCSFAMKIPTFTCSTSCRPGPFKEPGNIYTSLFVLRLGEIIICIEHKKVRVLYFLGFISVCDEIEDNPGTRPMVPLVLVMETHDKAISVMCYCCGILMYRSIILQDNGLIAAEGSTFKLSMAFGCCSSNIWPNN